MNARRMLAWLLCLVAFFPNSQGFAESMGPVTCEFEIPRLENITIDGGATDWADGGFHVDVLTSVNGPIRPTSQFDALLRFGWDDRGLLLLLTVHDTTPGEDDSSDYLYLKDSVELFIADDVGSLARYQIVVAPGVDGNHEQLRFRVYDRRSRETATAFTPILARTKLPNGYMLEAMLPWTALNITPALGSHCAINVMVHDYLALDQSRASQAWFPSARSASTPTATYRLRLAQKPSRPLTAAVTATYERFRRLNLAFRIRDQGDGKPSQVSVRDGDRLLESQMAASTPGLQETILRIPVLFPARLSGDLTAMVDGVPLLPLELPDLDELRCRAFDKAEFNFHDCVFDQIQLPEGDFDQPNLVEDMVGQYTIHTTFYDRDYQPVTTATRPGRYGAVSEITTQQGWKRVIFRTLYRSPQRLSFKTKTEMGFSVQFPPQLGLDPAVIGARANDVTQFFQWQFLKGFAKTQETAILLAALAEAKAGDPVVERTSALALDNLWWHPLKKKFNPSTYPYVIKLPTAYESDHLVRWPLIIFLHGSGERGDDLELYAKNPRVRQLPHQSGDRFVIASPLCPANERWEAWSLSDLVDELAAKYQIDLDRVYLTGESMGGIGTWSGGQALPDRFAAIAPIAGYGDPLDVARIKDLPTWAFHGDADTTVPFAKDRETVEALRKVGGRVRFTIYAGVGHDASTPAYANTELYAWFLEQRRGHPEERAATQNR